MKIRYALLNKKAIPPKKKNQTDAGIDLFAPEDIIIPPFSMKLVKTGVTLEVPEGYFFLLKPKGRNNHLVGAGVVDAYYHPGEIVVKIFNPTGKPIQIKRGKGIAQAVLIPIPKVELIEAKKEDLENLHSRSGSGGILEQLREEVKQQLQSPLD